jgi:DNA replication and repair protein RecF
LPAQPVLLRPDAERALAPAAGNEAPGLALSRLVLSDFRCYRRAEIAPPAKPVVLHGPNGAGKTNLLEAISFLAPGRGLRRARLAEIERQRGAGEAPGPGWALFAEVVTPEGRHRIGTGRDPERSSGPDGAPGDDADRRVVRIDGAAVKGQAALAERVHLLWLTPEMDRLFAEGPSERRRFVDRIVTNFVPDHARNLAAYEHAMRERTRLLKSNIADAAWLGALEQSMAESGVAVAAARRDVVGRLAAAAAATRTAFPVPELALAGETEAELARGPALAVEERLRERFAASRGADAEAGRALAGPHRSDLRVTHRAKGMPAALCSTGEQKALLVALVLAAARLLKLRRGAAPLLLLDEIAAHLDQERRSALFDEIAALGAQAWMTGTDAALFAALGSRVAYCAVADGTLSP